MRIKRISKDDLFGIFYVKKPDGTRWGSYYKTLEALRPLFEDKEFSKIVKGFYLNICGDFDSVRVSYFVDKANAEKAVSIFEQFFKNNGILEIQDSKYPKEIILAKNYGGDECRRAFQKFSSSRNTNRARADNWKLVAGKNFVCNLSVAS